MKRSWIPSLRCPLCHGSFHVDASREAGEEWVEGLLLCRLCLATWPLVGGSALLPSDLRAHLREQASVYRRTRLADPRVTRLVLAGLGSGVDMVPFEELTAHYGDLVADAQAERPRAPEDHALDEVLRAAAGERPLGRALDLGCGVGRSTFLLAAHGADALGADRSAARVRRARNLAVTEVDFYLPTPEEPGREAPLNLSGLARSAVDFAVVTPTCLPFADGVFDLVVDHGADGRGVWSDPERVRAEVWRVLCAGGRVLEPVPAPEGAGPGRVKGPGWRLAVRA